MSRLAPPSTIPDFTGSVTTPADPGYDDARRVWNVMHDRRPALVAHPRTPADVAAAIAFARAESLRIAVRCGGHSLPGHSTVDDGLVIDMRAFDGVEVDPVSRTVRVGGGAPLGAVDAAVQAHGLVVPVGVVSHTGAGGLTLGGGVGRMMRRHGLTVDSLLAAEVVLADGSIVHAGDEEHPELFWGLRGGGGNFGIVTEFTFRAHRQGPLTVLAMFAPLGDLPAVLELGEATMADPDTPDELLWTSFVRRGPDFAPWMPERLANTPGIMSLIEWSGDPAEGRARLATIREHLAPPASDLSTVPYLAMQTVTDELLAPGTLHAYVKAGFASEVTPAMVDVLVRQGEKLGSPLSVIEILSMGGAIDRVAPAATAFPHRGSRWLINVPGQWRDRGHSDREIAWVRESFAALSPHLTGGSYANFMDDDEADLAARAYGATLARLAAVKRTYDPDNVFSLNQNIRPTAII